jgi:bifunctional N-acetylglucosamine-1-phosphate-uridyltransferase/glucosamine-1-phosphate-acetyltransferase GlmU-like protein
MTRWTGVVVASSAASEEEMMSRLPSYLHPVAGRPLIWHTVTSLARAELAPERIIVVGGADLGADMFLDVAHPAITVLRHDDLGGFDPLVGGDGVTAVVVADASSSVTPGAFERLAQSGRGSWLGDGDVIVAARLDPHLAPEVLRVPSPLQRTRGVISPAGKLQDREPPIAVRNRSHLAAVAEQVRHGIVHGHMAAGVTFLLPSSVLVDVDVRIGADTVIYPGVVLEGQTTIGAETVVGPACRIIDSWIGSGVELKGWNYVAHTSVRNRAILEPYVRRGFD